MGRFVRPVSIVGVASAKRIADMQVGEGGYTVPWSYNPDERTLDTNFCIHAEPLGTAKAYVLRRQDGFYMDLGGYKF